MTDIKCNVSGGASVVKCYIAGGVVKIKIDIDFTATSIGDYSSVDYGSDYFIGAAVSLDYSVLDYGVDYNMQ